MNIKKWIKYWFGIIFLSAVLLISVNYIIDPLNILHTKFLKQEYQMNERFLKIEYLTKHHEKYNSYMLGSSRIGTTHPSFVEQYIPHSKFYNLTIASGNLSDYLIHLKYFIKHKFELENLYIQIDIANMGYYGNSHLGNLGTYYPPVENKSLTIFYLEYLTSFQPLSIIGKIKKNFQEESQIEYFLETTGSYTKSKLEQRIIKNCEQYVKAEATFHINNTRFSSGVHIKKSLDAIKEIVRLSNENNIKLYIFTTPHNKNMMDTYKVNDYLNFIRGISKITNFYDFSGYNSITNNNCNYYEHSHYRPLVGKLISARIFEDKNIHIPEDFGIYITRDTIDEHLLNLQKDKNNPLFSK